MERYEIVATDTTYGIGPDKQFDELQALRDERDRLRAALGQATIALRYYAKTAISARAVEALEKMEKAQVFACFYCSQDHLWLASQDGWHATKKEGVKVRCEAKAALTPAGQRLTPNEAME
jgi:hypothetical protein